MSLWKNMLIKLSFLLSVVPLTARSKDNQILLYSKNTTLLETTGDTILTVFVDANYGQYCNISSAKGLQQMSTILYVMQTLNEYNYVPGWQLGLKMLDTCHDEIQVFKQVLRAAVEQSYAAPDYWTGILVPSSYSPTLEPLRNYGAVSIGTYGEENFTEPLIEILAHYLSIEHGIVDLALANTRHVLDRFLRATRDAGVCVKRDKYINDGDANVTETVIVAIGEINDIQGWMRQREALKDHGKTWLLLPLDTSDIDDLMPAGSYVIKPETLVFDREFSTESLNSSHGRDFAHHSPYLLSTGRAIIGLAKVLQNIRTRNCSADDEDEDEDGNCVASQSRRKSREEIRDIDVYKALRVQPRSHSVKYVVAMKTQHDLIDVALYEIEVSKSRVLRERMISEVSELCLENLVGNCENCTNFRERDDSHIVVTKVDIISRRILKDSVYVPIFMIAVVCGALACCVVAIFIFRRYATEKPLDGSPSLTLVLILADMFTLLTALPFCMADDYFGAENLNSRKILLTTLVHGFTFSIMLSRALCLALSTNDIALVAHSTNGYQQSLMAFFMYSVQVAMSIMYFILNTTHSSAVVRSPIFIALLGYDIFLLVAFFVVSRFVVQVQSNYHEGKCFFSTAVGLLMIWSIWLICFVLTQPENRDTIVSFGTIGTAYSIILGVLIPKTYHMIVHRARGTNLRRRFDSVNLPTDSIANTVTGQLRPFYVHSARENQSLQVPSNTCPNYYGASSPASKYLDRCTSPIQNEISGCNNNYGPRAEMREIDITSRVASQTLENIEIPRNPEISNDVIYAQPRIYRARRIILEEKSEITRNKDNFSPNPKLQDKMYPMRYMNPTRRGSKERIDEDENANEGEEFQEDVSRVTRF